MKLKKLLLFVSALSVSVLGVTLASTSTDFKNQNFANAYFEPYSIVMSSSNNKLFNETGSVAYSGNKNLKTNLGNDISFEYTDLMGLNNTWHVFKDNGYLYNVNPINGIKKMDITFKNADKSFKLYWSYDNTFRESKVYNELSATDSALSFDFNSCYPAFFKIVNTSGTNLNISSITIDYSCSVTLFNISASSEDESKGTVTGSGDYAYGDLVTLNATPKSGYDFFGWYLDDELVSTNPILSFTMDDNSRSYIAKFVVAYKLFIYSEDENHGTVVAPLECGVGKTVTISATGNRGYSFNYWYDEDLNIISDQASYSFVMPSHDITYYAGFFEGYRISLYSKNDYELTLTGDGVYLVDSTVTIKASLNYDRGYFIGWFNNGTLLSTDLEYSFLCEETLILEARWHNLRISNNTVTGYNTSSKHVYVPYGVTSIGYEAFKNCSVIETIDIPATVTSLESQSFQGCSSLQSIALPGVTFIGCNVFYNCTSLSFVTLSNSLTTIDYQSFLGCTSLTSITLPSTLTSIEQGLFRDCTSLSTINFNGTIQQWNNLSKEIYWRLNVPATYVSCSDGRVYF